MTIAVIGATRGTGREVVIQALERDHEVRALARDPRRVALEHPSLTVVMAPVVEGADAVICTLGHRRWFYPNSILSSGTRNVVSSMKRFGVRRLVCQTSLGVGESFGRLGLYYTLFVIPFILPMYYYDKKRQEDVVRESGLDFTIVRPAALTNGPARGSTRVGPAAESWVVTKRVSRSDVARFLLDEIDNSRFAGQAVSVA